MRLLRRASRLLQANINHLLETAEDPEVMIRQLILEMDESVAALRRETVNAIARQKRLERKLEDARIEADELEKNAELALEKGDEHLARAVLRRRVETMRRQEVLAEELDSAKSLAHRVKTDLRRMQEQIGHARLKKDELIRRKRAAEARLRTHEAARRSSDAIGTAMSDVGALQDGTSAFDGYADSIHEMEARAEADRELGDEHEDSDRKLRKLVETSKVDEELERLKKKRATV